MAKIVKKKKKLKVHNLVNMILFVSVLMYLGSILLLKSFNITLNKELTHLNATNQDTQKENETLRLEVAKYTERDYLLSVCDKYGVELNFDSDRITYIDDEE
ncbi:MAG: hypothetical protein ACI4U3_08650 [Traorella sp.]